MPWGTIEALVWTSVTCRDVQKPNASCHRCMKYIALENLPETAAFRPVHYDTTIKLAR